MSKAYLQETEDVLRLLYYLNRCSEGITYYVYVVPIYLRSTEKYVSNFARFGAFSVELKDKLLQSRFSTFPSRHDDRSAILVESSNRYIIITRRIQRRQFYPPPHMKNDVAYLSLPVKSS